MAVGPENQTDEIMGNIDYLDNDRLGWTLLICGHLWGVGQQVIGLGLSGWSRGWDWGKYVSVRWEGNWALDME